MCLTKSDLSGGLYKIPSRIGFDLGKKKNVKKNTFGIAAETVFVTICNPTFNVTSNTTTSP